MVKALRLIHEKEKQYANHLKEMRDYLWNELKQFDDVIINSPEDGAPHILNISVPGLKPEVMIHMLGEEGIYISTKSACSSKEKDESKILVACGFSRDIAISGLRISLSYENTMEEMKRFIDVFSRSLNQFKQVLR